MTALEQGKRLRGMYFTDTSLPHFDTDGDYLDFFRGAFYPTFPMIYATNRGILEEAKDKLQSLSIAARVRECSIDNLWALVCDQAELLYCPDYQI